MKILHAMAAMAFKFPHENRQERRLLQSMGWNPDEHDDDEGGLEVMRWAIRVGGEVAKWDRFPPIILETT